MRYKDRESWIGLNSGTLNPMKALFLGKVRIEGKASTLLDFMPLQKFIKQAFLETEKELDYEGSFSGN